MINMFKLNFSPRVLCWIHKGLMIVEIELNLQPLGSDLINALGWCHQKIQLFFLFNNITRILAIGDVNSGKISVFDGNSDNAELHVIENVHQKPIILMKVRKPVSQISNYNIANPGFSHSGKIQPESQFASLPT